MIQVRPASSWLTATVVDCVQVQGVVVPVFKVKGISPRKSSVDGRLLLAIMMSCAPCPNSFILLGNIE